MSGEKQPGIGLAGRKIGSSVIAKTPSVSPPAAAENSLRNQESTNRLPMAVTQKESKVSKMEPDSGTVIPLAKATRKMLDQQCWYHGLCSREECEPLLVKKGDFLVRATESQGFVSIILSFFTGDRVVHLTVDATDNGLFELKTLRGKSHQFPTVFDLVRHFRAHRIKLKNPDGSSLECRLGEGIPRPKWHVHSETISYDATSKPLGAGHFAQVFVGTFESDEKGEKKKIQVAIKVLKSKTGTEDEKAAKQAMIREGKVMSFYNHPNVVQFYGVACDRPQHVILVIEFCPGGSLDSHLIKQQDNIVVPERVTFCVESALGMRYLHSQKCIHRDLAARNCLISSAGIVKIADFGLSTMEGATEKDKVGNMPIRWMAPETLVKDPTFSTKSDIWAYAMLVYEIFNKGGLPWPADDNKRIATHIRHCKMPEMPAITPPAIKDVIRTIWVRDMTLRPSFREIVQKLRLIRDLFVAPLPSSCSVNRLPNVHRADLVMDDLSDLSMATGARSALDTSDKERRGTIMNNELDIDDIPKASLYMIDQHRRTPAAAVVKSADVPPRSPIAHPLAAAKAPPIHKGSQK